MVPMPGSIRMAILALVAASTARATSFFSSTAEKP